MNIRGIVSETAGWSDWGWISLQFELDEVSMCVRMTVLYKFVIIERTLIQDLGVLCILDLVVYCFMLMFI